LDQALNHESNFYNSSIVNAFSSSSSYESESADISISPSNISIIKKENERVDVDGISQLNRKDSGKSSFRKGVSIAHDNISVEVNSFTGRNTSSNHNSTIKEKEKSNKKECGFYCLECMERTTFSFRCGLCQTNRPIHQRKFKGQLLHHYCCARCTPWSNIWDCAQCSNYNRF